MHKETQMFPASDMFLKAELDYRREQLMKAAQPRGRRSRRRRSAGTHLLPRRSHRLRAA
jgi:hypothetical protein